MAITLQQTDTAADSGTSAGCSGETLNANATSVEATEGGTQGSTERMFDVSNGSTEAVMMFQTDVASGEPNGSTWDAGDYVVRMNVTTASNDLTWVATYICERDPDGNFSTVASLTGQTTDITTAGVHSHTINRGTDYTASSESSTLYFVCVVQNGHSHTTRTVGVTPDQQIDTPIVSSGTTEALSASLAGVSTDSAAPSLTDALSGTLAGSSADSFAASVTDALGATLAGTSGLSVAPTVSDALSATLAGSSSDSGAISGVGQQPTKIRIKFRPAGWVHPKWSN